MAKATVEPGFQEVTRMDADLADILRRYGHPHKRSRPQGFETLLQAIVSQQVSLAAAAAIWERLSQGLMDRDGSVSPESWLAHREDELRAYGLSRAKVTYGSALASAVHDGALDFRRLKRMSDEDAIDSLTAIKGIGRWTAEIYLLSALDRPDAWPAQDIALMTAMQDVKRLPERPTAKEMILLAENWRPLRAFAARLLWHHYRHAKAREVPF
jgi:DNA-3-methyladenine glycosylase II